MITIDLERCTGCGACVEACPTGALYLVDGKAAVDNALCRECEVCVQACPSEAIALTEQKELLTAPARQLVRRPEPEVIRVRTEAEIVPLRARVLPVVGAALIWAGREIVPRIVDVMLDAVDRRAIGRQMVATGCDDRAPSQGRRGRGQGHQHRHRRRGRR